MKRLAWFAVARTPYNDFLFATLSRVYDLTVVYTHKQLATHPWRFEGGAVKTLYVKDDFGACLRLARRADGIVFSGWHDPRYVMLLGLLPRSTPKTFWTDTPRPSNKRTVRELARRMVAQYVFRSFDEVWSTGKVGCEALRGLGCPPAKVRSFPFFYDLKSFDALTDEARRSAQAFREAHTAGRRGPVFMCGGQLARKKRFDDAVRALAAMPSTESVLWLCGVGPEEESLKTLAESLGVSSRVVFHGWLQAEALRLAFVAADVFVHPASFDPFPTVVLEAMTWGKAVIGTSVSGSVADRVVSGENGFVYEAGDVNALSRHMDFLARDDGALSRFKKAARETACKYPVELAIDRLRDLMTVGYGA